ncbi:hypothetical protein CGZ80_25635 [Rhodopirellula sp. MGV]|nr:hypothetical protein CGZ80_25635 [Rhodopirellula sp. MGV]PNY37039.1 thioredoxin [Rhodopirellula baltica]
MAVDFGDSSESGGDSESAEVTSASHQVDPFDDAESGSSGLVLMKFGAPWCPPCRMVDKELVDLAKANLPVEVRKIDVDHRQDLADQYDVSSIPRLILKEDGEVIGDLVGYQSAAQLEAWIRDNASQEALSASNEPKLPTVYANPFMK